MSNNLHETNNYSIRSKFSAVENGYFKDEYLRFFVNKERESWRRTPIINRGYSTRLWAMDWSVSRAIKYGNVDCFIIFGGGYDTLPLRWLAKTKNVTFIELDLLEVVDTKAKILNQHNIIDNLEKDPESECYHSAFYHLLTCDLRDENQLRRTLSAILQDIIYRNVCLINEVCFCYLERNDVIRILESVVGILTNAFKIDYIGFEQVNYLDDNLVSAFSKIMLNHFEAYGYPIKYYPSNDDIQHIFREVLNFNYITTLSVHHFYHNVLMNDITDYDIETIEPFDEFEELDLFFAHYCLVTASKILKQPIRLPTPFEHQNECVKVASGAKIREESFLEKVDSYHVSASPYYTRHAHASCKIQSNEKLLIYGGFGCFPHHNENKSKVDKYNMRHKRLNDFLIVDPNDPSTMPQELSITPKLESLLTGRMHSKLISFPGSNLLLISGGRQSPSRPACDTLLLQLVNLGDKLEMDLKEKIEIQQNTWRHCMCIMPDRSVLQLGGLSQNNSDAICTQLKLDGNRLGSSKVILGDKYVNRHSFCMCNLSSRSAIIFGGLSNERYSSFSPVESDCSFQVIDLRQKGITSFSLDNCSEYGYYSSTMHKINDFELVVVGGISSRTGQCDNIVMNYDLRNRQVVRRLQIVSDSKFEKYLMLHNHISVLNNNNILTFGGGSGGYFTFGSGLNDSIVSVSTR